MIKNVVIYHHEQNQFVPKLTFQTMHVRIDPEELEESPDTALEPILHVLSAYPFEKAAGYFTPHDFKHFIDVMQTQKTRQLTTNDILCFDIHKERVCYQSDQFDWIPLPNDWERQIKNKE